MRACEQPRHKVKDAGQTDTEALLAEGGPSAAGGAETQVLLLARELARRGYAVGIVARWDLSLGDVDRTRAARARAEAAAEALRWEERQAEREITAAETAFRRVCGSRGRRCAPSNRRC